MTSCSLYFLFLSLQSVWNKRGWSLPVPSWTESLVEVDIKYVDLLNQIVKRIVWLRKKKKGYAGKEGLPGENGKGTKQPVQQSEGEWEREWGVCIQA